MLFSALVESKPEVSSTLTCRVVPSIVSQGHSAPTPSSHSYHGRSALTDTAAVAMEGLLSRAQLTLSGSLSLSPTATAASPAGKHTGGGHRTTKFRDGLQPRLCAMLVPILIGVATISLLQYFSHEQVVRASYSAVLEEAGHTATAYLTAPLASASIAATVVGLHFSSLDDHIGTERADQAIVDTLRTFNQTSSVLVVNSKGLLSGAGRFLVRSYGRGCAVAGLT